MRRFRAQTEARATWLITGAGGYIGSAVAASCKGELVLLDSCEGNLFELRRRLGSGYRYVLGSVEDGALVDELFERFRPDVVIHAAAFKHVELLELNPFAAIRNNVLGTYRLIQAALRYRCRSLVLVSTDKAVRPHSVMGVSKRIAEVLTVSLSNAECRMNAVRLGNVTGSTGSVVPIFLEQIARGQAVTVTHPDATRYFLSIDEAVAAILDAAASDRGGCVCLPNFDAPVRIADLARRLMNGTANIPVEIIGLRPGEKLTEDLIGPHEAPGPDDPRAVITPKLSPEACEGMIHRIASCLDQRDLAALIETVTSFVPDYVPSRAMLP